MNRLYAVLRLREILNILASTCPCQRLRILPDLKRLKRTPVSKVSQFAVMMGAKLAGDLVQNEKMFLVIQFYLSGTIFPGNIEAQ